jgi:hypothetical protein
MKARGIYKVWADTKRGNLPTIKFRSFHPRAKNQFIKCRSQKEYVVYVTFLRAIGFVTI